MTGTAADVNGATLQCGHGGVITVTASARLTVNSNGVLLAGAEAGLSFATGSPACSNTTTNGAAAPCTTSPATSGTTARLTVAHTKVVLGSAGGDTVSAGKPGNLTWKVASPGQGRLTSA